MIGLSSLKRFELDRGDFPSDQLVSFAQIAILVQRFAPGPATADTSAVVDLLCQMSCNLFTACDAYQNAVGIGLYPLAAMMNHSCAPNAVASFRGRAYELRLLSDVPAGTELCVAYAELAAPPALRRADLRARYFFDCGCSQCADAAHGATLSALACSHCSGAVVAADSCTCSWERWRGGVCRGC
jgi:SET and MYND domain-containing protein